MKKLLTVAGLLLVLGLTAYILMPAKSPAPPFALADLHGNIVGNQNLQGKVTFINFWFPSCPGCVSEMPKVIKMSKDYQGKAFQVWGIAQPIDPVDSVKTYVATHGLPFTVMYDGDGAVGKAFGTQVYPTSVLIDKEGNVLKTFVGEPDFAKLYQDIDRVLAD